MKVSHTLDLLRVAFDDPRLVADAGLLLPATLAQRLSLKRLLDEHVDLGGVPGSANPGEKALTVVAGLLAGGDRINLRSGGCHRLFGNMKSSVQVRQPPS